MSKNLKLNFEDFESIRKEEMIGPYQIPVYKVMLVRESGQKSAVKSVKRPQDVYEIVKNNLAGADREYFMVMMLDIKSRIIGINTVAIGVLSSCPIHPREVFKPAIISNSAGIILIHNNPSPKMSPPLVYERQRHWHPWF
jgi:DNA repair protein RadC